MSIAAGIHARHGVSPSEQDVITAYCRMDPGISAHGLSAARWWGFPLPLDVETPIIPSADGTYPIEASVAPRASDRRVHLAYPTPGRRSTTLVRWGTRGFLPGEVVAVEGARVTSRLRTLLDLAGVLTVDDLVQIGDHLVRLPRPWFEQRRNPFATPQQLRAAAQAFSGRGSRRLREAMDLVRLSSDSPAETRLRLAFVRHGLPEPLANVRAYAGDVDLGQPDLHWPQWGVAVEHEGPGHLDRRQQRRDIKRGEKRRNHGWREVCTTAEDLHDDCWGAVHRATAALRRQGWDGTVTRLR